jgi:hypothetical protein
MAKFNFYDAGPVNPYWRLVQPDSGLVYDAANSAFTTTTTWANSHTHLAAADSTGGRAVNLPAGLPSGQWDWLLYDNATPADTDAVVKMKRIQIGASGGLGEVPTTIADI